MNKRAKHIPNLTKRQMRMLRKEISQGERMAWQNDMKFAAKQPLISRLRISMMILFNLVDYYLLEKDRPFKVWLRIGLFWLLILFQIIILTLLTYFLIIQ